MHLKSAFPANMSLPSLLSALNTGPPRAVRLNRSGPGTLASLALSFARTGQNVLVAARGAGEFSELRSLLTLFSPETPERKSVQEQWKRPVVSMPPYPPGNFGKSGWAERMSALYALKMGHSAQIILVSLDNFFMRLPPQDFFSEHELRLSKGMDMAPDLVLDQAVDWGYTRVSLVGAPGDVAMRGDILDIFCPGYSKPLRLEFFGDVLDDLRHFDPSSQRSVADVPEMTLLPVAPVILSRAQRLKADAFWQGELRAGRLTGADLSGFMRLADAGGAGLFPGAYYQEASCLEEWLPRECVFLLPGEQEILPLLEEGERLWAECLDAEANSRGFRQPAGRVLRTAAETERFLAGTRRIHWEDLRVGLPENAHGNLALPERAISAFQDLFPLPEDQERPWGRLVSLLRA
ncbi:MAG: transcription-repair coupling factor, partial [Deltaproteobacteria bacterium]|nr:transcription-repair coupling factor [Deltaproteobacteria bacterium]